MTYRVSGRLSACASRPDTMQALRSLQYRHKTPALSKNFCRRYNSEERIRIAIFTAFAAQMTILIPLVGGAAPSPPNKVILLCKISFHSVRVLPASRSWNDCQSTRRLNVVKKRVVFSKIFSICLRATKIF